MSKEKLVNIFDKQAQFYEKWRKKGSIDTKWRKKLIPYAKEKVLEIAVGAGANFQFYPKGVEVTAVDFSEEMLKKAKIAAQEEGLEVEFICSDVESISFPDNSFDSIISTLSFCGYEDPVKMLESINRWCKPGGQILLLEHGISSNRLIGSIQKLLNSVNLKFSGCHLKRDMIQILQDSPIRIDQMEHYLLDTVHLVWATPSKEDC